MYKYRLLTPGPVAVPERVRRARVARLRDTYGVHVAGGQNHVEGKIFRIGHMGDVDAYDMLTAIAALEMTLADLGYPVKLGEGTRTATEQLRALTAG